MRLVAAMLGLLVACEPHQADLRDDPAAPTVPALVNGDFSKGLDGWVADGAADRFGVFPDANYDGRQSVTTFVYGFEGGGGGATGSLSQTFQVPMDATALRFVIHGGHERVRLLDGDTELRQVSGPGSNRRRVPVSWGLLPHRGKTLTLVIEDTSSAPPWAFVSVSGFDVIRDRAGPLVNPDFEDGLEGWDVTGDASEFTSFRDPATGGRRSLTTALPDRGAEVDAAMGTLSQTFEVPADAVALRFAVHGGSRAAVRLWEGHTLLFEKSGPDTNVLRVPVSWDLQRYRGHTVTLSIEDEVRRGDFGFIGTTGFDLITLENGP